MRLALMKMMEVAPANVPRSNKTANMAFESGAFVAGRVECGAMRLSLMPRAAVYNDQPEAHKLSLEVVRAARRPAAGALGWRIAKISLTSDT
jgi:hypothetical protein